MSSHNTQSTPNTITVPWVKNNKAETTGRRLTMLTAYDYPIAKLLEEAGIHMVLVGDSLGPVIYGEANTLSVTMDEMIRHTRAVSKACTKSLVIGDMPFLSYHVSPAQALENAGRFIKEAGAQAVKLEGGLEMADTIRKITQAGIPVVAHIGLTPQSLHAMGSYRMHGKEEKERKYILDSAYAVAEAGAFAVVLECVEEKLATQITKVLSIPTIGIGSGSECDGQVLVIHDLLGLTSGKVPKFVNPTANLKPIILDAVAKYIERTVSMERPVNKTSLKPSDKSSEKPSEVPHASSH